MRMMLCVLLLVGCGTATTPVPPSATREQTEFLEQDTFAGRAKSYVAQARRSIEILKTETDPEKLRALNADLKNAYSLLQPPAAETEPQKDLERYLQNINVNFETAVDFQILHLAAEQTSDEEKKKSTKEDAEMMINGTPKICDQADEILKTEYQGFDVRAERPMPDRSK